MIYTMTLNPALDYVMHPLTLDMGFTNRSSSEELYCGGNGINISTLLKELDVPSIAMGIAGGFTGDYLLTELQDKGIASNFVRLDRGNTRININDIVAIISHLNGKTPANFLFEAADANVDESVNDTDLENVLSIIANSETNPETK